MPPNNFGIAVLDTGTEYGFYTQIVNNDTFSLLSATFDLPTNVVDPSITFIGPTPGPSIGLDLTSTSIQWSFTGFDTGEIFEFDWTAMLNGPSIPEGFGATLSNLDNTLITLVTTGGTVSGSLVYHLENGVETHLEVLIPSPVPEPSTFLLLGAGLPGLAAVAISRWKNE